MSINIRCKKCRGTNQLQAKVCKRCGESIGKERIYRIQVRVKGKWIVRQVGTLDEAKAVEVELKQQRIATATTVIGCMAGFLSEHQDSHKASDIL